MAYGQSFYNAKTDSVDTILNSRTVLRLSCKEIFPTISTTPKTYALMVKLSREDPAVFTEMTLDRCLESYLKSFP